MGININIHFIYDKDPTLARVVLCIQIFIYYDGIKGKCLDYKYKQKT